MSESHSILSSILKRGRLTSPGNSARYFSFKDSCSPSIFHDSGYNGSLKDPSFDYNDAEHKGEQNDTGLPEYSKHAHSSLSTSLSPIDHENVIFLSERKEPITHTDLYETPKVVKKDLSLRRRLLVSKSASVGSLGCSEKQVSSGSRQKKACLAHFLSLDEIISKCALDSPREKSYKPLATSTLKSEDPISGCQKLRLVFSQQRTSTIDDSKSKGGCLSEPGCLSPIQPKSSTNTPNIFIDNVLNSFNDQSTCPELIETPNCTLSETNDDRFITPINSLVEGFSLNISEINTPPVKEISDLSLSTPGSSSSYNSLSLDKSEESLSEHEGSFQELLQKRTESSSTLNSKRKVRKLQRSRRLSTLSECGSQSEKEEDCDTTVAHSKCILKIAGSITESNELVFHEDDKCMAPDFGSLSRTPALQIVRALFMQNRSKRTKQDDLLKKIDGVDISALKCIVAQLIGRKMGIEKLDILTELRIRDLRHVLTLILDILTVESLCSMWKVSRNWREIVIQDRHANRRRKLYIKQLAVEAKRHLPDTEDAATRLLMTRFALRSVQAQAKPAVLQMQPSCDESLTPRGCSPVLQSASKEEVCVKVAQSLFSDEALKPCPRCRCPAKYQAFQKRGLCSREDCAFDFCTLCLYAFHGSRDCSSPSAKRQNRKDALPGSAKSKRNLKRL
nr:F-box only protein 43 [Podarcis muralis]XP_028592229.1 F-box only protein 43 [Podarcis muralis]XP_028592230.1 F-box only protein 43 [Podarcis muralis]XP_028592231.1 F-box only protein 43 [Podarcis muralis]